MANYKALVFDLDGTLLKSDKTISSRTLENLRRCKSAGIAIGISTSRSENNSMKFIRELQPDFVISSGGALLKLHEKYVYRAEFSPEETSNIINMIREICGDDCEITVDTINAHFWNYKSNPLKSDPSWGGSVYSDFSDFSECALKICAEVKSAEQLQKLADECTNCDCIKFSDSNWCKFTKKSATKENAILRLCDVCGITTEEIIAFGDDFVDIGMLKLCGLGVAMGNAIDEVKQIADVVIGSNDCDGIAEFLEKMFFQSN